MPRLFTSGSGPLRSITVPCLLFFGCLSIASAELKVYDLRCEWRSNPLGVDRSAPCLSWKLASQQRGEQQTAYQLQVASSAEKLAQGEADLWDTKRVASAAQLGIVYDGQPLASSDRCWWRVRVWDADQNASAWSGPATWEMALITPNDWQAVWIDDGKPAPQQDAEHYHEDRAPLFRRTLEIKRPIKQARLYIAGLGYYDATLNGSPLGDRVLDPGWTAYDKRILYSTYDVTQLLTQGSNVIGVMLGNGWYNPLPLRMWGRINLREHLATGRPRLIAQLRIEFEDGGHQVIGTDESWRVAEGPIVRNNIYLGEEYDARLETPGWRRDGFDDSAWRKASLSSIGGVGQLRAQPQPPVRPIARLKTKQLTEPKRGVFVFDMGENFAGWARLKVEGPAGAKVSLRYGELLNDDGTVNALTSVCGQIKRPGVGGPGAPDIAYQEDRYTLRGYGVETYTPRFTFHAFRYVEVRGFPGKPTPQALEGIVLSADLQEAGSFSCSDPKLNRLQAACRRTFRSNLFSVQSDCPHRERFGYGGDIVATSDALMLNYDMHGLYAKTIFDFADSARDNGGLTETAPHTGVTAGGFGQRSGPIGWGIAHPLLLKQLRQYYGDERLIEEQHQVAKRWLELLAENTNNGIIDRGIGDHESLQKAARGVTGAGFYLQTAELLADLATAQGKTAEARQWKQLAEQIRAAFTKQFLNPQSGRIAKGSQGDQVTALYHRLVPQQDQSQVLERLLRSLKENDNRLTTGIFGTKYLLDVLPRSGHNELAYQLATSAGFPGWQNMLDHGATTLWEHWQYSDNTFSHNHPMFGSVSEWMFAHLAGIRVADDAVGCDQLEITPRLVDGLDWVHARYESVRGPVESSWKRTRTGAQFVVEVPMGAVATLTLPATFSDRLTESGVVIDKAKGVGVLEPEGGRLRYELAPGSYQFDAH